MHITNTLILDTVQETMHTTNCALHTTNWTLRTTHCTLNIKNSMMKTALNTACWTSLHTAHCLLYTAHCTLQTVYCRTLCIARHSVKLTLFPAKPRQSSVGNLASLTWVTQEDILVQLYTVFWKVLLTFITLGTSLGGHTSDLRWGGKCGMEGRLLGHEVWSDN